MLAATSEPGPVIGTMTLDLNWLVCQFTNSAGASGPSGFYRLQGQ